MAATPLVEKQRARLLVLNRAYDLSDGRRSVEFNSAALAPMLGLDHDQVRAAVEYLAAEGLVHVIGYNPGIAFCIEHAGVREVEAARSSPSEATDHFPAAVVSFVFNAPVGSVQTGPAAVANVTQRIGFDAGQVTRLIEALRRAIPAEADELREAIDDLAEEAAKPAPKQSRIRAFLTHARDLAKEYGPVVTLLAELARVLLAS